MKKFLIHITIFCCALLGMFVLILSQADGNTGAYYLKISSPQKNNLILGTSKAAQGIQPQILSNTLQKDFYNYAFSINNSPYGKTYLNSIKNKLDKSSPDNIFILTVDVWSICSQTDDPNDSLHFREKKSFLNTIEDVNQDPNFEFLLHHFEEKYYKLLSKNSPSFLHDNGWLEITLDDTEESVNRRTTFTISDYERKAAQYQFSETRFQYLLKTIDYLNNFGKVYLVRLPIHHELMKIEESILNDFDNTIFPAIKKSALYIDLSNYNLLQHYTDGAHLNVESGREMSNIIAEKIKDHEP